MHRWWLIVAGVALLVGVAHASPAAALADSADGYLMLDSGEPGGPDFAPLSGQTFVLTNEDEGEVTAPIGFPFELFGQAYTSVRIGVNGGMQLDADDVPASNRPMATNNTIGLFPLWDDWDNRNAIESFVRYGVVGSAPHRVFVVEWVDTVHFNAFIHAGDTVTFQAQLHESDDAVEFHYIDATTANAAFDAGMSATVGIDNGAGDGLEYSHLAGVLSDGMAIRFEPKFCEGLAATVIGTNGADVLRGTSGDDVVVGLGGADDIKTFGGADVVCGGGGDDVVNGGGGDDLLLGEGGADTLVGGPDHDELRGGGGDDDLTGAVGDDLLLGGADDDTIRGNGGTDQVDGGPGDDPLLSGGAGTDTIHGRDGDDVLQGNKGHDDDLAGGAGDDILNGGVGTDQLDGGPDSDVCNGGADGHVDTATACETEIAIP